MKRAKTSLLLGHAFLAGMAILVIEFVAQRWLDNTWGSSLDAWAATLSAVFALMALGYFLGGMLADRWPGKRLLPPVLFLASYLLLALAFFLPDILPALGRAIESSRLGPLLAALFLLGPPVAVLAGISPIVIRSLQEDTEHAGRIAGRVYAIGTVGSIAGALLTPYFLLGSFSLPLILAGTSLLLALAALIFARRWQMLLLLLPLILSPVAAAEDEQYRSRGGTELELRSSKYQTVAVSEKEGLRFLYFLSAPGAWQGVWDPEVPDRIQLAYVRALQRWKCIQPSPKRIAVLGVGAGSAIRAARRLSPRSQISGVELDPEVLKISRKWMGLPPPSKKISYYISDGRKWIREQKGLSVVLADVFSGEKTPPHFLTREFFAQVRSSLAPKGVLGMNLLASESSPWIPGVVAGARESFAEVQIYQVKGSANLILWASDNIKRGGSKPCLQKLEGFLESFKGELQGAPTAEVKKSKPWTDLLSPAP